MAKGEPLPENWELPKLGPCREDDRGRLYRCPDCAVGNPGWVVYLRFDHRVPTAFHGVLRYFRCPDCREKFVLREWDGCEPELAAS